jgi:hypothetical protein
MDTIHTILLIHISIILVHIIMVLDMVIITHITGTIITTTTITTITIITETQATQIIREEPVAPITNQQAPQEHLNPKTRLPPATAVMGEILGTMAEILIEEVQAVAADLEVRQVVDQAAVDHRAGIAIEDHRAAQEVLEEDNFNYVETKF